MDNSIFYILGGLLVVYFTIAVHNKRHGKKRRSREFMEGQRLKDREHSRENETNPK